MDYLTLAILIIIFNTFILASFVLFRTHIQSNRSSRVLQLLSHLSKLMANGCIVHQDLNQQVQF